MHPTTIPQDGRRLALNTTHKLIALFAGSVALVGLMVFASFQTFRNVETAGAARKLTFDLIIRADALLGDVAEAESSVRGFVITGNEGFLPPYLEVADKIAGRLKELPPLASASGSGKHLEALAPLIAARFAQMADVVELRRRNEASAGLAAVSGGEGKRLMDSIRVEMDALNRLEQAELVRHDAVVQSSMRDLFAVIVAASLFTLVFAFFFVYLIFRESKHRLGNLVHSETRRLLEREETSNLKLRQINTDLRISEEKLAVTLNSIGDAVITTDAEAKVTLLNPLAETLTGWTNTEAAGRPVADVFRIVDQDNRKPAIVPILETIATGAPNALPYHTILLARGGSEATIADSCAPIREPGGRVIGAVLVFRDVSSEDAARLALRDQQFYTRSLIESNVDALTATNPAGIITDANRQMETLTGCTRDELIGAAFKSCFTDPERAEAGIKMALREGKVNNFELTVRARDGRQTAVSYNATTFHDRKRRLQGVFAAARDVTESKRLELALQEQNLLLEGASALADKANQAKSDFLSSMSHELRTPLNAILGFAQLMETGAPPPTPSQKRNIGQILKAGWYLLELINEILDLSVIEAGKVTLSREPVSLVEVMLECRAMIEPQARERGIRIAFPRFDAPYFVLADRTRVKQILVNLLVNAVKYNHAGGTVTVECGPSPPDAIRISVRDTGAGLAPEQMAQLFQPFNRIGRDGGAEEGTGIGLVVTKRLVELMGGRIGADSTVGAGSVFWVELAAAHAPQLSVRGVETASAARLQAPAVVSLRTLLYVEDNPANLELVEQLVLRRADLQFLSAADGDTGIALARSCRPEVILMDINLPGINGIEAMQILRLDPATAHIPVIALSANAMERDVEKGLSAGFFNYLTKPIKVDAFMEALDAALDHSKSAAGRTIDKEAA